jgi:hypothetical protein
MVDPDRTASLMTPSKLAQIKPKSAVSPAVWLSQMAADAGHRHVHRLGELRMEMQAQARSRDMSSLTSQLALVAQALPQLDFGLLQNRGWWARTTGKSRSAGAEFAAQFHRIEQVAGTLAAPTLAFKTQQQAQATAADLTLLELEVEYHAVDKIIDQGARWLQDMRTQIKTRQAGTAKQAAQVQVIKEDEARCEILVARLKALRAVVSAAQQAHQAAQAAAARRAALLQLLQQTLAPGIKAWQGQLAALAVAAGGSGSPMLNVEDPMEIHRELQLSLKRANADCAQLKAQENALAESVAAFAAQVEAACPS